MFLVYFQVYFKQGFYIYCKKTSKLFWKLMHPLHHQYLFSVSGIIVSPYIAICSYSAASMKTIKALRNWIVHHKSQGLNLGMQSLVAQLQTSYMWINTHFPSKGSTITTLARFRKALKPKKMWSLFVNLVIRVVILC